MKLKFAVYFYNGRKYILHCTSVAFCYDILMGSGKRKPKKKRKNSDYVLIWKSTKISFLFSIIDQVSIFCLKYDFFKKDASKHIYIWY